MEIIGYRRIRDGVKLVDIINKAYELTESEQPSLPIPNLSQPTMEQYAEQMEIGLGRTDSATSIYFILGKPVYITVVQWCQRDICFRYLPEEWHYHSEELSKALIEEFCDPATPLEIPSVGEED